MFVDEADLISKLTVFIARVEGGRFTSFGTGLLISPRLVLTALHVVCPVGPDCTVPPHEDFDLRIRFEIGNADLAGRPGALPTFYPVRLVWPPANSKAVTDATDVALLALDNGKPDGGSASRIKDLAADDLEKFVKTKQLDQMTEFVRLGAQGEEREARFVGYPVYASQLLGTVLRNAGQSDLAVRANLRGKINDGVVDEATGLIMVHLEQDFEIKGDKQNPLAGLSGASVHRKLPNERGVNVFGVVNRFPGGRLLTVAPIPKLTDESAQSGFWSIASKSKLTPLATIVRTDRAIECLHFLDRDRPVATYLGSYRQVPAPPRAYLFVNIATNFDGHNFFWRRLSITSRIDHPPLFDIDAFAAQSVVTTIATMNGPADCQYVLSDLAGLINAPTPPGASLEAAVAERFASSACPRLLFFDIDWRTMFDHRTDEIREGVTPTLTELVRLLSVWGAKAPAPLAGTVFERTNPLVAVLTVMVMVREKDPDDALDKARDLAPKLVHLIRAAARPPEGVWCDIHPDPLGHVTFSDFRNWGIKHLQDPQFADDIGNLMDPPFNGGGLDFSNIIAGLKYARTR